MNRIVWAVSHAGPPRLRCPHANPAQSTVLGKLIQWAFAGRDRGNFQLPVLVHTRSKAFLMSFGEKLHVAPRAICMQHRILIQYFSEGTMWIWSENVAQHVSPSRD